MQNVLKRPVPKPILKPKQKLISVIPKPAETLAVMHQQLDLIGAKIALTKSGVGAKTALKDSIDYDKLTPTQQRRWDDGTFGCIQLKNVKGYQYYYLRWTDPATKKMRSKYLAKDWDDAARKQRMLTA
jgi:hypothetical protein